LRVLYDVTAVKRNYCDIGCLELRTGVLGERNFIVDFMWSFERGT